MCGLAAPAAAQVPAAPEGLGTMGTGDGVVTLVWSNPGDVSITRYEYRHEVGSGAWGLWTNIPGSGPTTTSYTFTGLANFVVHRLQIRAVNAAGASQPSIIRTAQPVGQLPAPTGLTATPGDSEVKLRWTMPSGAWIDDVYGYQYQKKEGSSGAWEAWTKSSGVLNLSTTHTVTGLTNGTTYYFKVRAMGISDSGLGSNVASATPIAAQWPDTPDAPILIPGDSEIAVSWTAPAANRASISDYDVRYRAGNSGPWTNWDAATTSTALSTVITSLTNGQALPGAGAGEKQRGPVELVGQRPRHAGGRRRPRARPLPPAISSSR